jgi:hypothetical protein
MNGRDARIAAEVNAWFYTKEDKYAPAHTVCDIAGLFAESIEKKGFKLSLSFKNFRDRICEATCTMYKAYLESAEVRGPAKIPYAPKNWSKEIEEIWEDYIHMFVLTEDFWQAFWYDIYTSVWESQFPNYRYYIQSILPLYIQRDYELLEENNLIIQNDDGEYIDVNEYDGEEEYKNEYDS